MPPLSRDAIFAVLSGLTALACDKGGAAVTAEPPASAAAADASKPSTAASTGEPVKEVAPATSAGKPAEKEKTCSPSGCAPGQCGANKK
jgi:hypothetical protein